MIDLEEIRQKVKSFKIHEEVYAFSDELQRRGLRICPRNIYCDEVSKHICTIAKSGCRKRYATCFKKYFKEIEE